MCACDVRQGHRRFSSNRRGHKGHNYPWFPKTPFSQQFKVANAVYDLGTTEIRSGTMRDGMEAKSNDD